MGNDTFYRRGKRLTLRRDKFKTIDRCPVSGKHKYQSHTQALVKGGEVLKEGEALRAYLCDACESYHLTSKV